MAFIAAFVTVAAFLGLQPEKRKLLQFEYISSTSLISSAKPDQAIRLLYQGRSIGQLTTVSGRLANVGELPIQAREVEVVGNEMRFPTLEFGESVGVLDCRIAGTSKVGITARCDVNENKVIIEHGLLNPGDSIGIEVQLEGSAGPIPQLPAVHYRIVGIQEEKTIFPRDVRIAHGASYFALPRSADWVITTVSAVVALAMLFVGMAGCVAGTDGAFESRTKVAKRLSEEFADDRLYDRFRFAMNHIDPRVAHLDAKVTVEWADSVQCIQEALERSPETAHLAAGDQAQLARTVFHSLRRELIHELASAAGKSAKSLSARMRAGDAVRAMEIEENELTINVIKRAREAALDAIVPTTVFGRFALFDWTMIAFALATALGALFVALVVSGAWGRMLAQ